MSGKVLYGRIEVIAGGELSGEISKVVAEESAAAPAESAESPLAAAAEPVAVSPALPEDDVDLAAEGD